MSLLRQQSNLELRVNAYDRPPSREEFLRESKDCDGVLVLTTESSRRRISEKC